MESAVTTPLVDIDSVKINCGVCRCASKVVGDRGTDSGVIICCIADWHLAIAFGRHVGFDIAHCCFDEGTSAGIGVIVGNFISGKIAEDVGVGGKHVDDTDVSLEYLHSP